MRRFAVTAFAVPVTLLAVGDAAPAKSGPTTIPLGPESWAAGSDRVNCTVGHDENGQPVDLPGPLR